MSDWGYNFNYDKEHDMVDDRQMLITTSPKTWLESPHVGRINVTGIFILENLGFMIQDDTLNYKSCGP